MFVATVSMSGLGPDGSLTGYTYVTRDGAPYVNFRAQYFNMTPETTQRLNFAVQDFLKANPGDNLKDEEAFLNWEKKACAMLLGIGEQLIKDKKERKAKKEQEAKAEAATKAAGSH